MPMKMPSYQGGGSLEHLLRPSGLQAMNSAQQYQKLVSMRAQTAQMQREDNAMREFQRMAGAGAGVAELGEMTDRQRRDLEASDVLLQGRPFIPDLQGGYMTSGAERANARTQARRQGRVDSGAIQGRNRGLGRERKRENWIQLKPSHS